MRTKLPRMRNDPIHDITTSSCSSVPFLIALHSLAPVPAVAPGSSALLTGFRVLTRIVSHLLPGPFPTHTGPCWFLFHAAQCRLALSSQTPWLASDKRDSPVSLCTCPPTSYCTLWTLFSCPAYLPLLLETDHLASSF